MTGPDYRKLLFLFIAYIWFNKFAGAVLPPHFLEKGLDLRQILLGTILVFCGIFLLVVLKISNRLATRNSWRLAMVFFLAYILLTVEISSPLKFYFASLLNGFSIYLFYIFYNAAYFKNTPREKTGRGSAVMFSIGPFLSVLAPLLAGIAAQANYFYVWTLSGLFFLVPFWLAGRQKNFPVKYDLKSAFREIRQTRLFIFIEGVWEAMIMGIIPVYTLFFIEKPLGYASFLAYLSLISIAANFIISRKTDKLQKRVVFLYPLTVAMAVVTFLFPLATRGLVWWIVLTGILQFTIPLFWSLTMAMVVDAHPNLELAMSGRELALTTGRILGLALAFLSFTFEKTPFFIFFVLGAVMLLFPLILFWRTRVRKKFAYL